MVQAFVITLREGLEAFLIVAISLAYLQEERTPGTDFGRPLGHRAGGGDQHWRGISLRASGQPIAVGRNPRDRGRCFRRVAHRPHVADGRHIKHDIEGHLRSSAFKTGTAAFLGVFAFTLLMITREGMETALLMGSWCFR